MANTNFIYVVPIKPKHDNYPMNIMDKIEPAVRYSLTTEVKNTLAGALDKRIKLWRSQPKFVGVYRRPTSNEMVLTIVIGGSELAKNRWKWVSLGTRRTGTIRAGYFVMKFRRYVPKTLPGNTYGRPAPRRIGPTYYSEEVKASSIEPREFETHVVKEEAYKVYRIVKKSIDTVVRSS